MKEKISGLLFVLSALISYSCSSDDYISAIPESANALASVEWGEMTENDTTFNIAAEHILKSIFHVDKIQDSGLDFSKKLYCFESPDGFLGMVASVDNEDAFADWLDWASQNNLCQKVKEKRSIIYTSFGNSWLLAEKGHKMLVMGPTVVSQQAALLQQMARWLEQDEDISIKGTPMFDKLEAMNGRMALVAQTSSLPEMMVAPLSLGAPKDAGPSQVMIAAEMSMHGDEVYIESECFSFDKKINDAIESNLSKLGLYKGSYNQQIPKNALFILALNGDGNHLLQLIRANKGFQNLMTGINTAIDFDNIIRCVNGDLVLAAQSENQIYMYGCLANRNFVQDIPYWKQSCPKGSQIVDQAPDQWLFKSNDTSFLFGIDGNMFYGKLNVSDSSVSEHLDNKAIPSRKLSYLINFQNDKNEVAKTLRGIVEPVFGNANRIVYTLK